MIKSLCAYTYKDALAKFTHNPHTLFRRKDAVSASFYLTPNSLTLNEHTISISGFPFPIKVERLICLLSLITLFYLALF